MSLKNIDELLSTGTQAAVEDKPEPVEKVEVSESNNDEPVEKVEAEKPEPVERPEAQNKPEPDKTQKVEEKAERDEAKQDEPNIDEYGNPLKKAKMFTNEEVQEMIRDRLARERASNQNKVEQKPEVSTDFKFDSESKDTLEVQLKKFMLHTMEESKRETDREAIRQEETKKQVEFETKFNSGFDRYDDFRSVVSGKPLTDAMMLAVRDMNDPAAFIYAASKTQAKELDRISKLPDALSQAREIGKLEERMKKVRSGISGASRPLDKHSSDMGTTKETKKIDLDARIMQYNKTKNRR